MFDKVNVRCDSAGDRSDLLNGLFGAGFIWHRGLEHADNVDQVNREYGYEQWPWILINMGRRDIAGIPPINDAGPILLQWPRDRDRILGRPEAAWGRFAYWHINVEPWGVQVGCKLLDDDDLDRLQTAVDKVVSGEVEHERVFVAGRRLSVCRDHIGYGEYRMPIHDFEDLLKTLEDVRDVFNPQG